MFHNLTEYTRKKGLVFLPGFDSKDVRWAIVCDEAGRYLNLVEIGDTSDKKNRGQTFSLCPTFTQPEMKAGGITKSHFLVDTVDVVTLYGKRTKDPKMQAKHNYFFKLLRESASILPVLKHLADNIDTPVILALIDESLKEQKAAESDKITFRIGNSYPLQSNIWHEWWQALRHDLPVSKSNRPMRCFLTGELVLPALTHFPKIKGLKPVGGATSGDALVSFDEESFWSGALKQSANASMSEEAVVTYCVALNQLLKNHSVTLAGTKIVHWFKEHVPPEDDPLFFLSSGETEELAAQQRAKELVESIKTGKRRDLQHNFYYALTMSGASGRVMVRDWMEGQFEELVESIDSWFEDISICRENSNEFCKTPGIERLITCLLPPRKRNQDYANWIKPLGSERIKLWHVAIRREPIPFSIIGLIVPLHRSFMLSGELEEARKTKDQSKINQLLSVLSNRMGLLKAYHIRPDKMKGVKPSMKPYLNEEHPAPAYHCGRLMAVLARLQQSALGNVGAGVVQRYYTAASSTPALILGRLTSLSQHHLNKLDSPGLTNWYESQIANIWGRIKDKIPSTLSLEEQSLFALGYYQQLADMKTKKSGNTENEKETKDE